MENIKENNNFLVYILQSDLDKSYYIGQTAKTIEGRLREHNEGLSVYTAKKRPWTVVYCERFNSRTEAMKREIFLKKQKNKEVYQKLIRSGSSAG